MPESLQVHANALFDQLPQPAAEPFSKYSRLTDDDKALIWHLHKADKTQTEIAQVVGCSQPAVGEWLRKLQPLDQMAKLRSSNLAYEAVESLARAFPAAEKAGKHGPQATLLEVAGLIKGEDMGAPKVVVQIGVSDSLVKVNVSSVSPSLVPHNELAE